MSRTTRVRLEDGTALIAPERLLSEHTAWLRSLERAVPPVAPKPAWGVDMAATDPFAGAVLIDATEPPIVVRARDVAEGHAAWVRDMCRGTVCGALAHLDKQGSTP